MEEAEYDVGRAEESATQSTNGITTRTQPFIKRQPTKKVAKEE
jgi:hypothetical protein